MAIASGAYSSATEGFALSKKYQLDGRTEYDTLADMAAVKDIRMPEMLLAYCYEDRQVYLFNKENEKDDTLGKWRKFLPENEVKFFEYIKESPSKKWIVSHNLDLEQPTVLVYDGEGNHIIGDITFNSTNKLTIAFCTAVSGTAYIKP